MHVSVSKAALHAVSRPRTPSQCHVGSDMNNRPDIQMMHRANGTQAAANLPKYPSELPSTAGEKLRVKRAGQHRGVTAWSLTQWRQGCPQPRHPAQPMGQHCMRRHQCIYTRTPRLYARPINAFRHLLHNETLPGQSALGRAPGDRLGSAEREPKATTHLLLSGGSAGPSPPLPGTLRQGDATCCGGSQCREPPQTGLDSGACTPV